MRNFENKVIDVPVASVSTISEGTLSGGISTRSRYTKCDGLLSASCGGDADADADADVDLDETGGDDDDDDEISVEAVAECLL